FFQDEDLEGVFDWSDAADDQIGSCRSSCLANWRRHSQPHLRRPGALLVAPPTEVVSAGLTVQNLFRRWLPSEQLQFVRHHLHRTALTALLHSLLPTVYYVYMAVACPHLQLLPNPLKAAAVWRCLAIVAIAAPAAAACLYWRWTRAGFRHHPIAAKLARAARNSNWAEVASAIDVEFRRYDKFVTGQMGRQLIVTDGWLLQTSAYTVQVAPQASLMLRVLSADEHRVSPDSGPLGAQILRIAVIPLDSDRFGQFEVRVNSAVYSDLREKLTAPVTAAQSVMIRQSLSDQFVEAFAECVAENGRFRGAPGQQQQQQPQQCLGCLNQPADCRIARAATAPGTAADAAASRCGAAAVLADGSPAGRPRLAGRRRRGCPAKRLVRHAGRSSACL
uniref:VASt domain-containing protein n=1 Tax=Macrostomum lignano TaxID=282301 RepID=A0A1I8FAQ8_9PLAT